MDEASLDGGLFELASDNSSLFRELVNSAEANEREELFRELIPSELLVTPRAFWASLVD